MLERLEARLARRRVRRTGPEMTARPRVTEAPGSDGLPLVDHIVILMQENHSYDNYLGTLGRGDGLAPGPDGLPAATNPGSDGPVRLRHLESTVQVKHVPTQSWAASHLQFGDGACDGFVTGTSQTAPGYDATAAMGYWDERDLRFYHGLARTFPLATRWFCSCLGPTFPNRRFLISGTANGLIDDLPFGMIDHPEKGTIFDLLTAHGISWANYHEVSAPRIAWRLLSHARGAAWLRLLGGYVAAFVPGLAHVMLSKVQVTADLYPLGALGLANHIKPMREFFAAAKAGTLPSVSLIDPDFRYCSEENPQDIQAGEGFSEAVINAVMSGPAWGKTLLIWCYDEHGGYYDHVPPPAAPAPDDVPARGSLERFGLLRLLRGTGFGREISRADAGPVTYERLGFRVPAVIVSPYARPDYVTDQVYDHTSVLRLIQLKWNLPSLTRRDAVATPPLDALDFDSPPHFADPPKLPRAAQPYQPDGARQKRNHLQR